MTKAERYVRKHLADELEEVQGSPIAAVENGLTIYEKVLIYHYTKDGYREFNRNLRSRAVPLPELASLLAGIEEAPKSARSGSSNFTAYSRTNPKVSNRA